MDLIIVGVDGSEGSRAALTFAIEEARRHGAHIRAVGAWRIPTTVYAGGYAPIENVGLDLESDARRALEGVIADADADGVEIDAVISQGHPAAVLLAEARDADLLVVGSRGLGGFRGLLLGSVSQECAHHSSCPIVIIPSREAEAPSAGDS